jgi:hypothetical protein
MNWYYAAGGQQQGPVEDAQFDALINAGTIMPDTLVWREGLANWQPLRELRPPATNPSALPPVAGVPPVVGGETGSAGGVICCECGKSFPIDQVIKYQDRYVCATCKPVFLQRLAEGASLVSPGGAILTEEQVLEGDYRIEIGECLERAWKLFTSNAGPIIGASIVAVLVAMACGFVASAIGFVTRATNPVLSWLVNSLISSLYSGPLMAGYVYFLLRLVRGEDASVSDALSGFRRRYGQLALASLVQSGATTLCFLPVMFFVLRGVSGGSPSPGLIAGAGLAIVAGIAAVVYLTTIWMFSLLLIIDKGYAFWPAMQLSRKMVSKRWWMTWLFLLVAGIISVAGVLACGIGLLVTVPLFFAMEAYLYEDNFGNLRPAS